MKVAILGASPKKDRYSYHAMQRLESAGHQVYLVHPSLEQIEGRAVYAGLGALPAGIDVLTVYVNSKAVAELEPELIAGGFKAVIFNPGTEAPGIYAHLQDAGTQCIEACTLVMLSVGTFPKF